MISYKNKFNLRVLFWFLAICTAILIFFFSSQISEESTTVSNSVTAVIARIFVKNYDIMSEYDQYIVISSMNGFVRKAAHFSIYTVLAVFVTSALTTYPTLSIRLRAVYSILLCTAYASSDELHQYFVPGRSCELRDVFIDACGAVLGIFIVTAVMYFYRQKKHNS